jgi:hypothetical protein
VLENQKDVCEEDPSKKAVKRELGETAIHSPLYRLG